MKLISKIFNIFTVSAMVPFIAGQLTFISSCGVNYTIKESKTLDVCTWENNQKVKETTSDIIYFNICSDIPYISVENGFKLAKHEHSKHYNDEVFDFTITKSNGKVTVTREKGNDAQMVFDPSANTITFSDYGKFLTPGTVVTETMCRNYGKIEPYRSENVKYISYGDNITRIKSVENTVFDFNKYNIKLIPYGNDVFLPFTTFSDIILNDCYRPMVAFKDTIFCAYDILSGTSESAKKQRDWLKTISLTPTKQLLEYNYNETCFVLDNYYGFIEKRKLPNFDQYFSSNGLKEKFLKSIEDADLALSYTMGILFDDLHSGFLQWSPSTNSTTLEKHRGHNYKRFWDNHSRLSTLRTNALTDNWKPFDIINSETDNATAVITFDDFSVASTDWYTSGVPKTVDQSTEAIGLFLHAYNKIHDYDSQHADKPISRIIVDETCNTGGEEFTCMFIASMLAGGQVGHAYRNNIDKAINYCTFLADANLDHKIDSKDKEWASKKIYVLTSAATFSCGSMLANSVRNLPNVKLIGKKTGGGCSMVLPGSNVFGTSYQLAGPYECGYVKNGSFYDYDAGIAPAFYVPDDLYYERTLLVDYLKQFEKP